MPGVLHGDINSSIIVGAEHWGAEMTRGESFAISGTTEQIFCWDMANNGWSAWYHIGSATYQLKYNIYDSENV
jgi:hypothetical protein